MPDVEPFGYLIEMLEQLGYCTGDGGLSWLEVNAWAQATSTKATYWEVVMLKRLSMIFFNSAKRFRDSAETSPFILESRDPKELVKQLKEGFRQVAPEQEND